MKMLRLYRWRKKILLPLAAIPMFQVTGTCVLQDLTAQLASSLAFATFSALVGAFQSALLQAFPSSDILQVLLGANRTPFFP
jgi:hypothetical protein